MVLVTMTPSTDASPAILDLFCTHEELFLAFERISSGCPLPGNVLRDIDPYQLNPSYLPGDIWYYVESNGNTYSSFGHWKPKGEACKLYSNSSFTGWRTAFEFYECQAPHERKTAWVMYKYWISQTDFCESSKKKEAGSLCQVFIGDEQFPNHKMIQKIDPSVISNEEQVNPNHLVNRDSSKNMANGSTSRSQTGKGDEMVELAVAEKLLNHQHLEHDFDMDYLRGDFLELRDLDLDVDEPGSPSSSSDNSSCLTMSSDEYFDSMALIQDIERDFNADKVQRGAACKCSSSTSFRLKKVAVHEGISESLISSGGNNLQAEENLRTESAVPGSNGSSKVSKERDSKQLSQNQKAVGYKLKGPSSSSHARAVSPNGNETDVDGVKKGSASDGRKKKKGKKYLCFMAFL